MIYVKCFTFNAFAENTYLLYDDTKDCIIVDPGCYSEKEKEILKNYIETTHLKIVKNINTHCHIDHVLGNYFVKNTFGVDFLISKEEESVLKAAISYAPVYGFPDYQPIEPDGFLNEKTSLTFGNSSLSILFVPGHSPGHLAFYASKEGFCINGDVLFRESIGRTDLPFGNTQILMNSIRNKMFSLPNETIIYCGHGPQTTIAHEKRYNAFCRL